MKWIFLIVLVFSGSVVYSQPACDSVCIYIIPLDSSPFIDYDATPDFVRQNCQVKLSITNFHIIEGLVEQYTLLKRKKICQKNKKDCNTCRVVIDFFYKNKRSFNVSISHMRIYFFDDIKSGEEIAIYEEDKDFMCYLRKKFATLLENNPDFRECQKD
jgi:hypothetical protein